MGCLLCFALCEETVLAWYMWDLRKTKHQKLKGQREMDWQRRSSAAWCISWEALGALFNLIRLFWFLVEVISPLRQWDWLIKKSLVYYCHNTISGYLRAHFPLPQVLERVVIQSMAWTASLFCSRPWIVHLIWGTLSNLSTNPSTWILELLSFPG